MRDDKPSQFDRVFDSLIWVAVIGFCLLFTWALTNGS
jgi:hypothetical protein